MPAAAEAPWRARGELDVTVDLNLWLVDRWVALGVADRRQAVRDPDVAHEGEERLRQRLAPVRVTQACDGDAHELCCAQVALGRGRGRRARVADADGSHIGGVDMKVLLATDGMPCSRPAEDLVATIRMRKEPGEILARHGFSFSG